MRGGASVLYLQEHLPALGVKCTLVCAKGSEMAVRGREQGANVVELPRSGDADVGFIFAASARQEAQAGSGACAQPPARMGRGWRKWAGVPAVLSRRVDNAEGRRRPSYPLYRHGGRGGGARRSAIVLVSNGVAAEKITVVHSAINPASSSSPRGTKEALAQTFGLDASAPIVGIRGPTDSA